MIKDVLIDIFSSVAASCITGFFGNKAIAKNSSLVLKTYVIFLSAFSFIVAAIISIVLNKGLAERLQQISEANLLRFYDNCIHTLLFLFLFFSIVTVGIIIAEYLQRSEKQSHKESMDRIRAVYKDNDKNE